jgi:hypothetical protein
VPNWCDDEQEIIGRRLLKLRRRLDTFVNPLVYTFWGSHGPSIMTMPAALAE